MAGIDKLVEKMKNQPSGIRFDEASRVLERYGYRQVRKKGSHRQFRNEAGDLTQYNTVIPLVKAM